MDELKIYREQIDLIDNQLIQLLFNRFEVVKKVWVYKKKHNLPPLQPERWQQVLKNIKAKWDEFWLSQEFIEKIWNEIHEYALSLEK